MLLWIPFFSWVMEQQQYESVESGEAGEGNASGLVEQMFVQTIETTTI